MASSLIGALRVSLGLDSAEFETGSKRARADSKKLAAGISADLASVKNAASLASNAIKGFLAVEVVQSIVGAARAGLEYASSLGEVAQQLGVTTKELQEYRYVASQVGVSQAEMDTALSKLTKTIGEAKAGSKTQVETFRELGVSIEDVNGRVYTAGELIPKLAGAISQIKDPATRARIEIELFGRAGQKLDTLLSAGTGEVNNLRDAAQKLGIVLSDEQIQKADDTADKLAAVKQVLEARIAGIVSDNAGSIMELANSLNNLAGAANSALSYYQRFRNFISSVPLGPQVLSAASYATNPLGALASMAGKALPKGRPGSSVRVAIPDAPVPDGALPTVKPSAGAKPKKGSAAASKKTGPSMADLINESIGNITLDDLENTKREANDAARRVYDSLGIDPGGDLSQLLYGSESKQAGIDAAIKKNEEIAIDYRERMGDQIHSLAGMYESLFLGGTGNIWESFKRQGVRIISQLLAQWTVGAMTGKGGGIGGLFSSIGSALGVGGSDTGIVAGGNRTIGAINDASKLPAFATGGSFKVGGVSGRDRNLVSFRASRGEMVNISKGENDNRGGPYFDLRGAVMTEDLLGQMNAIGQAAVIGGAALGRQQDARARRRRL